MAASGREAKALVYVKPDDDMAKVVHTLTHHKCSMAPILSVDPGGSEVRGAHADLLRVWRGAHLQRRLWGGPGRWEVRTLTYCMCGMAPILSADSSGAREVGARREKGQGSCSTSHHGSSMARTQGAAGGQARGDRAGVACNQWRTMEAAWRPPPAQTRGSAK